MHLSLALNNQSIKIRFRLQEQQELDCIEVVPRFIFLIYTIEHEFKCTSFSCNFLKVVRIKSLKISVIYTIEQLIRFMYLSVHLVLVTF